MRLRRQTAKLKHALGPGIGSSKRLPAHHRQTHDLIVEVFDPRVEIRGSEHLRHPCSLRLVRGAGAYPPAPTVNQPILPVLLESVAQAPEMALAKSKKFSRTNTT